MKKVNFGGKRPTVGVPQVGEEIDNWVASQATGVEPTKRLTIDVPISLHKRVKSRCAMENLIMADVIRDILERRFPKHESAETSVIAVTKREGEGSAS